MTLLSLIKILHLVGLIMGFGGAVFADLTILRGAILKPIRHQTVTTVRSLSHICFAGLGMLWVSGAALVYIRVSADPHMLMNEKLWAKIMIVIILSINGIMVHRIALSRLARREGRRLFSTDRQVEIARLTFIGAVSSVSWVLPFILGVATEFNFTVRAIEILSFYLWLIIVAWTMMFLLVCAVSDEQSHWRSSHFRAERLAHFGGRPGAVNGWIRRRILEWRSQRAERLLTA